MNNSIDEILCTPISPAIAEGDNFLLRAAFSSPYLPHPNHKNKSHPHKKGIINTCEVRNLSNLVMYCGGDVPYIKEGKLRENYTIKVVG
jgi:hypothetical protein